ncbi:hypothetical protein MBLNU457_5825t1 [Dothideomycetes sp. NU457]
MALTNGADSKPAEQARKPQRNRIVPAIPMKFSRAPTVKKNPVSVVEPQPQLSEQEIAPTVSDKVQSKEESQTIAPEAAPLHDVNGTLVIESTSNEDVVSDNVNGEPIHEEKEVVVQEEDKDNSASNSTEPHPADRIDENDVLETGQKLAQPEVNGRRNQLPPPFYPASHSAMPTARAQSSSQVGNGPAYLPAPSLFTFGGAAESDHSPTPPASAGSGLSSSNMMHTANGAGATAPFMPNSSAHSSAPSFSGPQASPFSPADPYQNFYGMPSTSQPWTQPHMPSSNNQIPQPYMQNGVSQKAPTPSSRSGSQASLAPEHSAMSRAYASHQHNASTSNQQPFYPPQHFQGHGNRMQQPEARNSRQSNAAEVNFWSLQAHLDEQFAQPEFADCTLAIGEHIALPSHSVILSRNPTLRALLRAGVYSNSAQSGDSHRKSLTVPPEYYFKSAPALVEAIRYLYAGPVFNEHRLMQPFLHSSRQLMENILSYAAAGSALAIPEIAVAALTVASHRLTWESLETALEFAVEGGLNPSWRQNAAGPDHLDSSSTDKPTGATYGLYASDVLEMAIRFVCWNIAPNFQLDTSASQLTTMRRLPEIAAQVSPIVHAPRGSVSDARFKGIRLGSFETQTSASTTLSSVLVSVPLPVLQAIFDDLQMQNRISPVVVEGIAYSIVSEREKRRTAAVAGSAHTNGVNGDGNRSGGMYSALHAREEMQISETGFPRLRFVSRLEESAAP